MMEEFEIDTLRVGKLYGATLLPNNVVRPFRLEAERKRAPQAAEETAANIAAWLQPKGYSVKQEKQQ
jgi:hypothetical protein